MSYTQTVSDTLMGLLTQAGIGKSEVKIRGEMNYSRFVSYCDALVREGCLTPAKRNELVVMGLTRINSGTAARRTM